MKFGEKLFQTKLLSRLSHKVCRLLSSAVLLRKLTIEKANLFQIQVKSRDSGIGVQGNLHQCCDGSYSGMERISDEDEEEFLILLTIMK